MAMRTTTAPTIINKPKEYLGSIAANPFDQRRAPFALNRNGGASCHSRDSLFSDSADNAVTLQLQHRMIVDDVF